MKHGKIVVTGVRSNQTQETPKRPTLGLDDSKRRGDPVPLSVRTVYMPFEAPKVSELGRPRRVDRTPSTVIEVK